MQNIAKKEMLQIVGSLTGAKRGVPLHEGAKRSLKRGVKQKMIVPLTMENEKEVKKIIKLGVEVRNYPIKGLRLDLVDEKVCLLSIVDESLPYNRATITIENYVFCKGMKKMFNSLWEKSKPISF